MNHPPKYLRTPHWPDSETVHRDDTYHLDPEFFVDKDVVVTEKLDGGCTALWDGEVYARSTTQPSHAGWMAMVRKHHAWKTRDTEIDPYLTFYGEDIYGIHSIEYAPVREDQTFRMFALRHSEPGQTDYFHSWDTVEIMAERMDILPVPVRFRGVFESTKAITKWFQDEIKLGSILGDTCEGFVIRTQSGFNAEDFSTNVAKYVRAKHVQTNEHWTRNWQPCKLT